MTLRVSSGQVVGPLVLTKTAGYTETAMVGDLVILADLAAGFTIVLPTAVGNTARITIKKVQSAGTITIDGAGTETIDGQLTFPLYYQYSSVTLVSNNVGWMEVNALNDPLPLGSTTAALFATTTPAIPTEGIALYGVKRANRRMIGYITPTGRTERLGPWLGSNNRLEYSANVGQSTFTSANITFAASAPATAAAPLAATSYLALQRRTSQTLAAAGVIYQYSASLIGGRNPGFGGGGFHVCFRFGLSQLGASNNLTNYRLFCGLRAANTAPTSVDPTTQFSIIGFGKNSADTTFSMMANGATGTAQKIPVTGGLVNTGSAAAATVLNAMYQVEIFCKAGDTQFGYRVTRTLANGTESVDEGVTTGTQGGAGGIPGDTILFTPVLYLGVVNAETHIMNFIQFFCETD